MSTHQIETHTKTKTPSPQQHRPWNKPPNPVAHHPAAIIQRARAAPESLSAADVMQLQRTIGNQAVGRLLAGIGTIPSHQAPVQRQDVPEDEELLQGKMIETVQRQPEPEEEELLQGKFTDECVQCQMPEEEEELLQGKGLTLQAQEGVPPNRTGMPDHLKSGLENLSGMDLSGVRVQYGSSKPAQLNALAYTQGQDIHVAPGQEKHLPHEGWHAVQQMQGRVRPTGKLGAMSLNDSRTLESEADSMGRKALQQYAQAEKPKENKSRAVANTIVQKKSNGKQGFGFVDNRPEAVAQRTLQDAIKRYSQTQAIIQRQLSDEELEDWVDRPEEELGWMDSTERRQLAVYKIDKAALGSIKSQGNYKTWKYDGEDYHINLKYDTRHVTWESKNREHYFFKGNGEEIKDKQPTRQEKGQHAHVFSALPVDLQKFIKKHFLKLF